MGKKGNCGCGGGCMKCGGHLKKMGHGGYHSDEPYDAVSEAQAAYDAEVQRIREVRKRMLSEANERVENPGTRTDLAWIDQGRWFCNSYSCEIGRDAGITMPQQDKPYDIYGTKYTGGEGMPLIPGNQDFDSRAAAMGFQWTDNPQPGDIAREQLWRTKDYQGNPITPGWHTGHSLIYQGKNDEGENMYYNAPGGLRYDYALQDEHTIVHGMRPSTGYNDRDNTYRMKYLTYVGDLPRLEANLEEAKRRAREARMEKMPMREIKKLDTEVKEAELKLLDVQAQADKYQMQMDKYDYKRDKKLNKKRKRQLKKSQYGGNMNYLQQGGYPDMMGSMGGSGMPMGYMQAGGEVDPGINEPQQPGPPPTPPSPFNPFDRFRPFGGNRPGWNPTPGSGPLGGGFSNWMQNIRENLAEQKANREANQQWNPNYQATQQSMFAKQQLAPRSEFMKQGGNLPAYQGGGGVDWGSIAKIAAVALPAVVGIGKSIANNRKKKKAEKEGSSGGGGNGVNAQQEADRQWQMMQQQMDMQKQMMQMYAMNNMNYGPGTTYGGSSFGGYSPQVAGSYGMTYYEHGGGLPQHGLGDFLKKAVNKAKGASGGIANKAGGMGQGLMGKIGKAAAGAGNRMGQSFNNMAQGAMGAAKGAGQGMWNNMQNSAQNIAQGAQGFGQNAMQGNFRGALQNAGQMGRGAFGMSPMGNTFAAAKGAAPGMGQMARGAFQGMTPQIGAAQGLGLMQQGGLIKDDSGSIIGKDDMKPGPGGYGTMGEFNMLTPQEKIDWMDAVSKMPGNAMAPGWKPTLAEYNKMDAETKKAYKKPKK